MMLVTDRSKARVLCLSAAVFFALPLHQVAYGQVTLLNPERSGSVTRNNCTGGGRLNENWVSNSLGAVSESVGLPNPTPPPTFIISVAQVSNFDSSALEHAGTANVLAQGISPCTTNYVGIDRSEVTLAVSAETDFQLTGTFGGTERANLQVRLTDLSTSMDVFFADGNNLNFAGTGDFGGTLAPGSYQFSLETSIVGSASSPSGTPAQNYNLDVRLGIGAGQPQIEINPNPVDLGDVDILIGNEVPVQVTNTGAVDLTLTNMEISAPLNDQGGINEFRLRNFNPGPQPLFPVVIPPGESRFPVAVMFTPSVVGFASTSMTVESNDPVSPVISIAVLGNGVDILGATDCFGLPATIQGTDAGEVIIGTRGDDVIAGLGGNDYIRGRGGNDTICGGPGADTILGNAGDDRIDGNEGDDTLVGGPGIDLLIGGEGADVIQGSGEGDVLDGNGAADRLFGGGGPDVLNGGAGDDVLIGNGDSDTMDGGEGSDICDNTGVDVIVQCELARN